MSERTVSVPWDSETTLTIHVTDKFEAVARKLFQLGPESNVTDEQIKETFLQCASSLTNVVQESTSEIECTDIQMEFESVSES